jgi:hypothetical protein
MPQSKKQSRAPKPKPAAARNVPANISSEWVQEWAPKFDMKGMDLRERATLAICQAVLRRDAGCGTPFEQFFHDVVFSMVITGSPTPDYVAQELEEFRTNWDHMKRDAVAFIAAYPDVVPVPKKASAAEPITKPPAARHRSRKPQKNAA